MSSPKRNDPPSLPKAGWSLLTDSKERKGSSEGGLLGSLIGSEGCWADLDGCIDGTDEGSDEGLNSLHPSTPGLK